MDWSDQNPFKGSEVEHVPLATARGFHVIASLGVGMSVCGWIVFVIGALWSANGGIVAESRGVHTGVYFASPLWLAGFLVSCFSLFLPSTVRARVGIWLGAIGVLCIALAIGWPA